MERQRVWVPDGAEGFIEGIVVDLGLDEVTVEPLDRKKGKLTATLDRVYPAEVYDNKDVEDNCEYQGKALDLPPIPHLTISILNSSLIPGSLMHLNEATLLNNIRIRYKKDKIYVSTLKDSFIHHWLIFTFHDFMAEVLYLSNICCRHMWQIS